MNLLEWLQNLKQHSRPIGALCGKKFDYESQPFGRYGFPRVIQFFDTRTVSKSYFPNLLKNTRKKNKNTEKNSIQLKTTHFTQRLNRKQAAYKHTLEDAHRGLMI